MNDVDHTPERRTVASLTRPKDSTMASAKWEVNIKRKYRVASSAIVFNIAESLWPPFFDRDMKKMVNEKARKSGARIYAGSA